ncbi:class I SAM-dependent methyltransferase [Sphaerisporangium corydalis]|uniref:Methyltransferase domain-containing protein n=1 Tax=Sphaerisporangium corydalis TaxID=1441875 RepID=A0ABV9EEN5_9ACTN|nr:class I SAM-dependent methyltransferase [Sphaerisporangium corydalis]
MSVSTTPLTVADLLTDFDGAAPDELDAEYQRLVGALWNDGELTDEALAATPLLVAHLDQVDDGRKGYLLVLLGLLAEAEYPVAGEVVAAVRQGMDRYLELLGAAVNGTPLTLALLYLVSHFPADRERVLAAAEHLELEPGDQTRLERGVRELDPADPDLGRVWPSPSVWKLTDAEREFDKEWIRGLTPAQIAKNWENDTRTMLGYSGAMAYWAVRYGVPVEIPGVAAAAGAAAAPAAELGADTFGQYDDALRCPACKGSLEFGDDKVRCASCSVTYPIARGILDLAEGVSEDVSDVTHEATSDLLQKLAEMPSMGLYYESVLRPAYLRIAGANWGGAVTPGDEDDYVAEHIAPVDGPVLDLAAGAGRWTAIVARTVGADRLIALDMGLPMLTVLREKLPAVPAVRASALDIPFEDASFGAVNCWNALHAFPDDAATAISEVGRVLRPGGTFTMMTFVFDSDPIARYFQESHFFPSRPEGMLLFTEVELRRWLADAGMSVRDYSGPGCFAYVTAVRD